MRELHWFACSFLGFLVLLFSACSSGGNGGAPQSSPPQGGGEAPGEVPVPPAPPEQISVPTGDVANFELTCGTVAPPMTGDMGVLTTDPVGCSLSSGGGFVNFSTPPELELTLDCAANRIVVSQPQGGASLLASLGSGGQFTVTATVDYFLKLDSVGNNDCDASADVTVEGVANCPGGGVSFTVHWDLKKNVRAVEQPPPLTPGGECILEQPCVLQTSTSLVCP